MNVCQSKAYYYNNTKLAVSTNKHIKTKFNVMGFEFSKFLQDLTNTKQISYVTSKNWDGNLLDSTDIMSIGNVMYTSYSIWLLITSIILLLAMVGSIVITIKQKY